MSIVTTTAAEGHTAVFSIDFAACAVVSARARKTKKRAMSNGNGSGNGNGNGTTKLHATFGERGQARVAYV